MRQSVTSGKWTGILLAAVIGCSGSTRQPAAAGSQEGSKASERSSKKRPLVLSEAKLPEGFPSPGPVGQVVLKEYPPYRAARVVAGRSGIQRSQNAMFGPLFNHIKRNDIAMTAPVEIGYEAQPASMQETDSRRPVSMAFLYREPVLGEVGKDPADPRVSVEDMPAVTALSVGVRGDYTARKLAEALGLIETWLAANPGQVEVAGPPRYLGYNSPMVPAFLRYGEVQVPVRRLQVNSSEQPLPATRSADR